MREIGLKRRLSRLFSCQNGRALIVPLDDSLLAGPTGGLIKHNDTLSKIVSANPDAILGFPGTLSSPLLANTGLILNLTMSTTLGQHVRKVDNYMLPLAVQADCLAVAHHVNFGGPEEPEMLQSMAKTCMSAHEVGMPVLGLAYLRKAGIEGDDNFECLAVEKPDEYFLRLSHAIRVSAEIGCDIIKTSVVPDDGPWDLLVDAALGVPLLLAGGPLIAFDKAIARAQIAITAGFSGVSYGRNVFHHSDPELAINQLRKVLNET